MTTATATTAASIPGLDDLERQIRPLSEEREKLEKEIAALPQRRALLDDVAGPLKDKLADGDRTASAPLEEIDQKLREISHCEESLHKRIAKIDARIQPIKQRIADLRRAATAAKNEAEFQEWCDGLDTRRERAKKYLRGLVQELAEIRLEGDKGARRWNNKALQAFERQIMEPFRNPMHELQQQGWRGPLTDYWKRDFYIIGLLPPIEQNGNGKPKS